MMKTNASLGLQSTDDRLIFEKSKAGKLGASLPARKFSDLNLAKEIPSKFQRAQDAKMPEVSEPEIVRHYVNLSKKNFSIDTHFYPLGSCTMKYNPKINEKVARWDGFAAVHPYQPEHEIQGFLQIFYELSRYLCEIAGMDEFTLQPSAGAQGEMCGLMLARAYHQSLGNHKKTKVIVPDSSHGTNPATAALAGFAVIQTPSNSRGRTDLKALKELVNDETACLMLTNPNTLGLFEDEILEIGEMVHKNGALLYYDGANLNPLLGIARPGDMGFDIVHINLHKTFSTPHGGGGPGAGPVGVKKKLIPFLPSPFLNKGKEGFFWDYDRPQSIGKLKSFYGNVGMLLRAYVYIRTLGLEGLKQVSKDAILNANYLRKKLEGVLQIPFPEFCMHEFVATVRNYKSKHIHASDVGKRLLDYGIHAPTVHFPLVVEDALMIEPTETESKEVLDKLVEALKAIVKEIEQDPQIVLTAPHTMPVKRPDEVQAARKPILSWRDFEIERSSSAKAS